MNETPVEELENIADDGYSLAEEILKHQPEEIKNKVRWLIKKSGIREDDPLFLILLACRINHILLENAPNDLENSFELGSQKIVNVFETHIDKLTEFEKKQLDRHSLHALRVSITKVNDAVVKVLKDNGVETKQEGKIPPKVKGMITVAISSAIFLIIGWIFGWSFETAVLGKRNQVNLSNAELAIYKWAMSREGRFAKQILDWNEDLLGQECQKKVGDLGVTIQIGTAKATSGYCWIWTVPPAKRNFSS
ncbi:DUF6753 family protein [Myxosarcina sp. GI1]|uniref:DUF6753 family protein n=1 Tax=Myxosarcina sp. GI1 TaxID=1541065 RepID=UPI0005670E1D|nr:DUF6753 family protein [Myxosarcina sp. GI1]